MNKPELYGKYNSFIKAAAVFYLDEYARKMKWNNIEESVMDLGCGDGGVTSIIKRYVPTKEVRFVASDISEKMVNYAREHYSKENITFRVFDLEGDLPKEWKHDFNHVFSFFAIQFIRNQEKAFRNIYDLLTEGGDCFLCFLRHMPCYDIFIRSSQGEKWKEWVKDVNKFVSPYNYIEDSEKKIIEMMENIGFTNIDVKCKKMKYMMQNGNEFKSFMKSVEPFNMPSEVFEKFANESVAVAQQIGILGKTSNSFEDHDKPIEFNYQVLVVYASKPSTNHQPPPAVYNML